MIDNKLPKHVAIIMDGNGRWAKKRFMPRLAGHKAGVETLKKIIEYSSNIGIKYLTVYAFSSENWNRPKNEIDGILKLLMVTFTKELEKLNENNVIIKMLGDKNNIPENVKNVFEKSELRTKNNTGLQLNVAFNYGGRDEILSSVKKIAELCIENKIDIDSISKELIEENLYTAGIPDPDFVIRTSGEIRLSNFLLWQISYSELYFTETFWPDFNVEEYAKALEEFKSRKRRYGKL